LKTNAFVFTGKYKPEPIEPLRLGGSEIAFNQLGEIFKDISRLQTKLEATPHRKKEEILLLSVGV